MRWRSSEAEGGSWKEKLQWTVRKGNKPKLLIKRSCLVVLSIHKKTYDPKVFRGSGIAIFPSFTSIIFKPGMEPQSPHPAGGGERLLVH